MNKSRSLSGSDGVFNNDFNWRILYGSIADTETAQIIQLLLIMTGGIERFRRRICGTNRFREGIVRITGVNASL